MLFLTQQQPTCVYEMLFSDAFTINMADIQEQNEYLIVPAVFTKEGVHNGSSGAKFKPYTELEKYASQLKGKPVVLGHPNPRRPVNLQRDPVLGEILDAYPRATDKAVAGTIKLNKAALPDWLYTAIKRGEKRAGSLGYYSRITPATGVYNGVGYDGVEGDFLWDHYAIGIPSGAAKVEDGCGLRFNSTLPQPLIQSKSNEVFFMENSEKEESFINRIVERLRKTGSEEEQKKVDQQKESEYQTKIKTLEEELKTLKKAKDEVDKQLQAYVDAEAAQAKAKKTELIKKIVGDSKEEAADYEEWSVAQLEKLSAKLASLQPENKEASASEAEAGIQLQPAPRADVSVKKPSSTVAAGANETGLTVGNSLFGKPQGSQ